MSRLILPSEPYFFGGAGSKLLQPLGTLAKYAFAVRLEADQGLFQDAASTTPATTNGDTVKAWKDLLNGTWAETFTNASNPCALSIENGTPTVDFSAPGWLLPQSSSHALSKARVWLGLKLTGEGSPGYKSGLTKTTGSSPQPIDFYANPGGSKFMFAGSGLATATEDYGLNAWRILSYAWEEGSNTSEIRYDNVVKGTGIAPTGTDTGQLILGSRGDFFTSLPGKLTSCLVYTGTLTEDDLAVIQTALAKKNPS